MQFAPSEFQTLLVDGARRMLEAKSGVEHWRGLRETETGYDAERWKAFAELGWLALATPESHGGLEGSLEDLVLLSVELGRAIAIEPFVSQGVECLPLLAGSVDTPPELVESALAGSTRLALAHRPPHGGQAPAKAVRSGDKVRLVGARAMVLDAPSADILIVSAPLEAGSAALWRVETSCDGVSRAAYPLIDGSRAADVTFDLEVSASALILAGENAEAALTQAVAHGRLARLAQAVGSMEASLELAGTYARERRQFGAPIASFQAIQHLLADMFVAADQARSMLYFATAGLKSGEPADGALAAASVIIGEAGQVVSRNGVQIHGGYGLTDEYAISHHYRRLLTLEKLAGDVEDNLGVLADGLRL